MSEESILKETALASIRKVGGDALLTQMINLFLTNAPKRLEALRTACDAGDLDGMSRAAHSLKSSSGNFGATGLQTMSGQIEQLASEGKGEPLPKLVADIEAAYEVVKVRLASERKPEE